MDYIFFGTPEFAVIILKKLISAGLRPKAVICNPDRPVGRKKILTPPPTKQLVYQLVADNQKQIAIFQPDKLSSDLIQNWRSIIGDWQFAVLAAYGKIIPASFLKNLGLGTIIGVHPSFLPKYRGATPIQSVLLSGELKTGTTLFVLDEKVDHGLVLAQEELDIRPDETKASLEKKLAELSADLLIRTLPSWIEGNIKPHAQDESKATYTKKIITEDGFVDLKKDDPKIIYRKVRALSPEPGVFTYIKKGGKKVRLKILEAAFKNGKIILKKVQEEGGKPVVLRGV